MKELDNKFKKAIAQQLKFLNTSENSENLVVDSIFELSVEYAKLTNQPPALNLDEVKTKLEAQSVILQEGLAMLNAFNQSKKTTTPQNGEIYYNKEQVRAIALKFFYHWWNSGGNNTEQGFDEWFRPDRWEALPGELISRKALLEELETDAADFKRFNDMTEHRTVTEIISKIKSL